MLCLCGPYLPDFGASRLSSSFIACVYTWRWAPNSVTDTPNRRPDNKQYINAAAAAAVIAATTAARARRHDRTDRAICTVRGNTKLKYSRSVNQSSSLHERRPLWSVTHYCNGSTSWLTKRNAVLRLFTNRRRIPTLPMPSHTAPNCFCNYRQITDLLKHQIQIYNGHYEIFVITESSNLVNRFSMLFAIFSLTARLKVAVSH